MCRKFQDTLWGILIMKLVYIKWLPRTTTIEVEGETTVMKYTYLLEHMVMESGKTLRSLVHMQLKFFKVCTSMRPAILTHVTIWTMSFIHMHINLWCQSQSHCGGTLWTTIDAWPTAIAGQRSSCEVKNKEWNGCGMARTEKPEGRFRLEGDSTEAAMRSVSSRGA